MYIQAGGVKLSVLSKTGREAVVAMLGPRRLLWRGEAGPAGPRGAEHLTGNARANDRTTRSRVNFFLNKFKKLGFIEGDGKLPLKINSSLLSVVLHD